MRFTSIRSRVYYLAGLFALLLVGSVTLATYFFVANGMTNAAEETSVRLATIAQRVVDGITADATIHAADIGVTGTDRDDVVRQDVLTRIPDVFSRGLIYEGFYALYVRSSDTAPLELVWETSGESGIPSTLGERLRALDRNQLVAEPPDIGGAFPGMFSEANLGFYVVHVPIELPGTASGVLDVAYEPTREEAILNATRVPMIGVVVLAFVASMFITNLIMGWTLALVDNIRHAADSIDVGRLDVHLPEEGEHEIAELARSLNRLIDELRHRNEAQTRFVADASHELATPVAGIRGYVNILRAWGAEDPALREEAVSAIDRESRRMARLCSDLLSVIRSEEMVEYRSIRYDINGVVREVLANAATRYIDKGLDIDGPDEEALWLYGDPDRIEEALGILIDNACKYTLEGGNVSVKSGREKDRVVVEVSDTGVGIPREDLPSVFERFYRSDISRSKETGGFGLGLAIAKHIVDASGGAISVASELGVGTTFTMSLPRQRSKS